MSNRLQAKKAVITAAGQGIGHATTLQFLKEGAIVWALDINPAPLKNLKEAFPELNIQVLNVTDRQAVFEFSQTIGFIDILFNCAGFVHQGTVLSTTEKDLDFSFNLNVKSMFYLIQAFLPGMIEQKQGNIINMSSVASSLLGVPDRFAYGTTKAAVIGLTRSIAADYAKDHIRCNAICPGTVQTPSLDERLHALGGNLEDKKTDFIARQPIGRLGTPEEIASLLTYLASDESSYVTGSIFTIDGGWSNQ